MVSPSNNITTCLFFGSCAEEAANFYVSIFPGATIDQVTKYPDTGEELGPPNLKPGSVLIVAFTLNGRSFTALNSRPDSIPMNEAVSLQVACDTQEEVDYYWNKLAEGGDESKQMCGWLQDKFGLSWQVFPKIVPQLMASGDPDRAARCMKAFSGMKKLILQDILDAVDGKK